MRAPGTALWTVLVVSACVASAPAVANEGGPDTFGHQWLDSEAPAPTETYSWQEIAPPQGGSGTELSSLNGADDETQTVAIGFSFDFYGNSYSDVIVSTNGLLAFSASSASAFSNSCLPDTADPDDLVAVFWDDLFLGHNAAEARIYAQTLGSAPNRRLVVEWYRVPHITDSASRFTFQAILYEGTNDIKAQYQTMTDGTGSFADGESATLGIENADGTDALEYFCGGRGPVRQPAPPVHDGLAIRYWVPRYDFGDAPDPTYPTLLASNGARHELTSGLWLGATVDAEADGQPDAAATGDDLAGVPDDEDGVVFTSPLAPGGTASVTVSSSGAGLLDAWVDFNADGDWTDAGEQVFSSQALAAGANALGFPVPAGSAAGVNTVARFRLSSAGGSAPSGAAVDGEVEDHPVTIQAPSISVTKTASPTTVDPPGAPVTFTVRVDNTGTAPVDLTSLSDDLHGDLNGQGTCSVPQTIPASGFYQCSFTVTVSGGGAGSETDTVTAAGSSAGVPVTAQGSATVSISAAADLAITKTDSQDPVAAGSQLTYIVEVINNGPDDAHNVVVTDVLPAGLTLVSTSGCAEDPTGVPTCSLGTITNGQTAQFSITAVVDESPPASITNTASVAADEVDTDPGNSSAAQQTTLQAREIPLLGGGGMALLALLLAAAGAAVLGRRVAGQ